MTDEDRNRASKWYSEYIRKTEVSLHIADTLKAYGRKESKRTAKNIAESLDRMAPIHRESCADEEDTRDGTTHCASLLEAIAAEIKRDYGIKE